MLGTGMLERWGATYMDAWGSLAARLYAGLRWLDEQTPCATIALLPPEGGLGSAIRQRLSKAAGRGDRV
jgi:hypothetical protein